MQMLRAEPSMLDAESDFVPLTHTDPVSDRFFHGHLSPSFAPDGALLPPPARPNLKVRSHAPHGVAPEPNPTTAPHRPRAPLGGLDLNRGRVTGPTKPNTTTTNTNTNTNRSTSTTTHPATTNQHSTAAVKSRPAAESAAVRADRPAWLGSAPVTPFAIRMARERRQRATEDVPVPPTKPKSRVEDRRAKKTTKEDGGLAFGSRAPDRLPALASRGGIHGLGNGNGVVNSHGSGNGGGGDGNGNNNVTCATTNPPPCPTTRVKTNKNASHASISSHARSLGLGGDRLRDRPATHGGQGSRPVASGHTRDVSLRRPGMGMGGMNQAEVEARIETVERALQERLSQGRGGSGLGPPTTTTTSGEGDGGQTQMNRLYACVDAIEVRSMCSYTRPRDSPRRTPTDESDAGPVGPRRCDHTLPLSPKREESLIHSTRVSSSILCATITIHP